MALTLSDMDNFTLEELDDFTLEELDNMSYSELVAAVHGKKQVVEKLCDQERQLSEEQFQMMVSIVHAYAKEQSISKKETLTINIATQLIGAFLIWCAQETVEHLPEIISALKQAYLLLEQLVNQIW